MVRVGKSIHLFVSPWEESVLMKSEARGFLFCCARPLLQSGTSIERLNFNQWLLLIVWSAGARGQLKLTPCRRVALRADDSVLFAIHSAQFNSAAATNTDRHFFSLRYFPVFVYRCRISPHAPDVTSSATVNNGSLCEVLTADLITSCNRHLPSTAPPLVTQHKGRAGPLLVSV